MQLERDYLVGKVFPALKKYCSNRDITLIELDLRWGINDEQSQQGKVTEICLREIENTNPFFIGLLGERYGWVPSREEMATQTNILESHPWIDKDFAQQLSITEIEMQYGVLRSKEEIHAYFYFRSPAMEVQEDFKDKPGSIEAQKLERLKNEIRSHAKSVQDYMSPEDLGKMVEQDFKALVDRIFPQGKLSFIEKERMQHKAFLKSRTIFYIPDADNNECINNFIASDASSLVITGASGMGKSALIANWIAANENSLDYKLIYHFVGNSNMEGDHRKITQRLINEIKSIFEQEEKNDELETPSANTYKEKEELERLLLAIAQKGKILIILDGINQLAEYENAKKLEWLPDFPQNIKVIYSTLLDDATMDVFHRREYEQLVLKPLTQEKREQLITGYLKIYSKTLMPDQIKRITTSKLCKNTLVLRTLLDELRVFGIHEKVGNQINYYLETQDNTQFFDKVLTRFEKEYNDDKHATYLVQEMLSLIAVSRAGMSEDELLHITGIAPIYWSHFYHAISCHLVTKNGLIYFGHQFLKDAVLKRYLQDVTLEKKQREKIIDFFEQQAEKNKRQYDELPYQLYLLGEFDKLHGFLLDFEVFDYIFDKNIHELGLYWRKLIETDKGKYKLSRYLYLGGIPEERLEQLGAVIPKPSKAIGVYQKRQKNSFYNKKNGS